MSASSPAAGGYLDDIVLPRQVWGHVVRSPHAPAAIDVSAAAAMPGVRGVYTAADLAEAGIGAIPCVMAPKGIDGSAAALAPRPVLADGRVRTVGDPVVFVAWRRTPPRPAPGRRPSLSTTARFRR